MSLFVFFLFSFLFCFLFFSKKISGTLLSNGLDPDQARHFVDLIWDQTGCKGYQQTTNDIGSMHRVNRKD